MGNKLDLVGNRYGRLTVVSCAPNHGTRTAWNCLCDCGTECVITTRDLRAGDTKSCGCYMKELAIERHKKHGASSHSGNATRLYRIWKHMRRRCLCPNNKAYKNYGGRGIKICDEWADSYIAFRDWSIAHGYKDSLTLDRIDNNGMYCPQNCRWASAVTQANNKRSNHLITHNGKTQTIAQWAREIDLSYFTLYSRIVKRKMDIAVALSMPLQKREVVG